jgi:tol-pal system protein YbgF
MAFQEETIGAKMLALGAALFAAVLLATGGCAMQDDVVAVDSRLAAVKRKVVLETREAEAERDALRAKMEEFREELKKLEEGHRTGYAEVRALMRDLREEMQELKGALEVTGHDVKQDLNVLLEWKSQEEHAREGLERRQETSLDRIVRLEQYLGLEPSEKLAASRPEETDKGEEEESAPKTADGLYVLAKEKFDQGEYERARELFEAFLEQYPKSDKADSAQFWIGEVYYREKWYEKAILEYQKVIEGYPTGNKIQSALLKQGFAFANLGDTANAKLILKELVRKYPDSNEAKIAKKKLAAL